MWQIYIGMFGSKEYWVCNNGLQEKYFNIDKKINVFWGSCGF